MPRARVASLRPRCRMVERRGRSRMQTSHEATCEFDVGAMQVACGWRRQRTCATKTDVQATSWPQEPGGTRIGLLDTSYFFFAAPDFFKPAPPSGPLPAAFDLRSFKAAASAFFLAMNSKSCCKMQPSGGACGRVTRQFHFLNIRRLALPTRTCAEAPTPRRFRRARSSPCYFVAERPRTSSYSLAPFLDCFSGFCFPPSLPTIFPVLHARLPACSVVETRVASPCKCTSNHHRRAPLHTSVHDLDGRSR